MNEYKIFYENNEKDLIKKRYENTLDMLPFTIKRLSKNQAFRLTFKKLKSKGYQDWIIYQAIVNNAINYRVNKQNPETTIESREMFFDFINRKEVESDLEVPFDHFSEESLEEAIDIGVISYIKGKGFEIRRRTPNIKSTRNFVAKHFKYFELEVDHKKWFDFQV